MQSVKTEEQHLDTSEWSDGGSHVCRKCEGYKAKAVNLEQQVKVASSQL